MRYKVRERESERESVSVKEREREREKVSESERESVYVCWLDKERTDDFGSNCKLPDNPNWENYNAKRKRPLRSAITARALVTTSDINPRNFGEPPEST